MWWHSSTNLSVSESQEDGMHKFNWSCVGKKYSGVVLYLSDPLLCSKSFWYCLQYSSIQFSKLSKRPNQDLKKSRLLIQISLESSRHIVAKQVYPQKSSVFWSISWHLPPEGNPVTTQCILNLYGYKGSSRLLAWWVECSALLSIFPWALFSEPDLLYSYLGSLRMQCCWICDALH